MPRQARSSRSSSWGCGSWWSAWPGQNSLRVQRRISSAPGVRTTSLFAHTTKPSCAAHDGSAGGYRRQRHGTRGSAPRHRDHRRRPAQRRLLRARCSACGWSRRPSTSTSPTSTTCTTATSSATPGSILTFFEFPGAAPGRAGAGMAAPDRVARRAPTPRSTSGRARLDDEDVAFTRAADGARALRRPRGPRARARRRRRARRAARRPCRRTSRPSTRCRASTACAPTRARPGASARAARGARLRRRRAAPTGASRGDAAPRALVATTRRPPDGGVQGAGSIHHVAWSAADDAELARLRARRRRRGRARRRRSSTASTSTPSTSASPAACCSSSPSRDVGFDVDEPLRVARPGAHAAAAVRAPARRSSSAR